MSELLHYGIQGQKWNLRRYQNQDGTYTEEGKARRRINYTQHGKEAADLYNNRSKYTTQELNEKFNRIQTEQRIKDFADQHKTKNVGEETVKNLGQTILKKTIESIANIAVTASGLYTFNQLLNNKNLAKVINGKIAALMIGGTAAKVAVSDNDK